MRLQEEEEGDERTARGAQRAAEETTGRSRRRTIRRSTSPCITGKGMEEAGNGGRCGLFRYLNLCSGAYWFLRRPRARRQCGRCGWLLLDNLCSNAYIGKKRRDWTNVNRWDWRSGCDVCTRLCTNVRPFDDVDMDVMGRMAAGGGRCFGSRGMLMLCRSTDTQTKSRGGQEGWMKGAEMEGEVSRQIDLAQGTCHGCTHVDVGLGLTACHRGTHHGGRYTCRDTCAQRCGGPFHVLAKSGVEDWSTEANGDGMAATMPLHPPFTSASAPQRQLEGPCASGALDAAVCEQWPTAAARLCRQARTHSDFHDDVGYGRGDEVKGQGGDCRDGWKGEQMLRGVVMNSWDATGGDAGGENARRSDGDRMRRYGDVCARTQLFVMERDASGRQPRGHRPAHRGPGRSSPSPAPWWRRGDLSGRRMPRCLRLRRRRDADEPRQCKRRHLSHGRGGGRVRLRACRRDPPRSGRPPPMRIGEAANPGPGSENNRATWGAFAAQDPRGAGFRDAVAPGFGSGGACEALDGCEQEELGLYSLQIVTVNITSWGSILDYVGVTTADVLLVQEHKLGRDQADEAVAWLRRRGWNALFTEASTGPNGGSCAGTAVLARAHVGLGLPLVGSEVVAMSRAVAARIEPPGSRPIVVVSAYLHDGQGLARCNLDLLGQIGSFIGAQGEGCPFVIGADFQITPEHLATTAIAKELGGLILATGDANGTCRTASSARELDYFIVSSGLADGVKSVDLVPRTGIRTHVPVALNFRPRLASLRALVVRKPPPLSTERIIGPVRRVADWPDLDKEAATLADDAMNQDIHEDIIHQRLGDLYRRWADEAEKELMECAVDGMKMPKRQLRGRAPVMVWRSILPEKTARGRDGLGTRWRNVATAALGLLRLVLDMRASRPRNDDRRHEDGGRDGIDPALDHDPCGDDRARIREQLESLAREAEEATKDFADLDDDVLRDDCAKGEDLLRAVVLLARRVAHGDAADANDLRNARAIRDAATKRVEEAAESHKKAQLEAWTAWIRRGIDAGARNAHRFSRVPPAWKPQPQVTPDGIVTTEPSKVVAAYRAKYSQRWNGPAAMHGEDRPRMNAPWKQAARCHMPKATPAQLREAARAFPHDTAVAFDGIALRHHDMVSDDALNVLAYIIVAMEAVGRLPPQLEALLMPMIGKERGGHRAITTAPSLYRLWGRLRRGLSQQWEAANDRAYFAAGKGRRVQDVIWRQALRAEAGDGQALSSATVLWDLAAYYDTLNRVRLWRQVIKHGFPLVIARLAFTVYDAPRALTLDGRVSCPTYARNGVPAGCPFANALSKVYVIDPFDEFVVSPPMQDASDAVFDDYVDDLVVSATGTSRHVEDTIVEAARELRRQVEDVLGCEIEVAKASVVASDPRLAARIAKRLGTYAGSGGGKASAVNLGCDYAPGRRRRFHRQSGKRHGRTLMLVKRTRRLARARKAIGSARRMRKVFTTGLLPAAIPDAAVNGVSDQEALLLRRAAATTCSPRARGRSLALVTLIHQVPTWRAEIEVVLQYSRQMWNASLLGHQRPRRGEFTLTEIAEKWRNVDKSAIFSGGPIGDLDGDAAVRRGGGDRARHDHRTGCEPEDARAGGGRDDGPGRARQAQVTDRGKSMWQSDGRKREWNNVKGPIGAMLLALHRVGWSMQDPYHVVDDRGEQIPLTKVTPAMLAILLKDATFRALERQIGARMAATDEDYHDRRICVDHVRSQLASDRSLTREGKAAYMSAACGAIMTYSRAVALGYLVEDLCPKCGCKGDTVRHRVYDCQDPEVVAARRRAAPSWFYDEVARRPTTQTRWTNGFVPHPADVWPAPASEAEPQTSYDGDDDPDFSDAGIPTLGGRLYVDGSCSRHVIADLRRAATAIVARDPEKGTTWRIRMAVPAPMVQTSQAAEFVALPMLLAYLRGTNGQWDVASDCAGVVRDCNLPGTRAIAGDRVYGGLLKPVVADAAWAKQVSIRKVPAHIDPRTVSGKAREDAEGNAEADAEAKKARQLHPQPTPALEQEVEALLKRARLVIRAMAATLPLFPPMPRERMQKRPAARDGAVIRGRGGHVWEFKAGFWRCSVCWALSVKPEISAHMAHQACPGPKQSLEAEAITARGHKLAHADGALPVLFCWDCGAYSARRAYGLGAACKGVPSRAGAQAIARIKRGEQPWEAREDGKRTRHRLGAVAAWDKHKGTYVHAEGIAAHGRRGVRRRPDGPADADEDEHDCDRARADGPWQLRERNVRPRLENAGGKGMHRADIFQATGDEHGDMMCVQADIAVEEAFGQEEARHGGIGISDEEDVFGHGGGLDQPDEAQLRRGPAGSGGDNRGVCEDYPSENVAGSAASSGHSQGGNDLRADDSAAAAVDDGEGTALVNRSGHHRGLVLTAMAKGVQLDACGACEGPGDPRADRATEAVAAMLGTPATTSVAATAREATTPQCLEHHARQATAARGEVAVGPPRGAAAPLDGRGCAGCNWPEVYSPHKRPRRLGVGPSAGLAEQLHDGDDPANTGRIERRRDGTAAPSPGAVARGGGDATACQDSGRPEAGLAPSTPGARNECRDEQGEGAMLDVHCARDAPEAAASGEGGGGSGRWAAEEESADRPARIHSVTVDNAAADVSRTSWDTSGGDDRTGQWDGEGHLARTRKMPARRNGHDGHVGDQLGRSTVAEDAAPYSPRQRPEEPAADGCEERRQFEEVGPRGRHSGGELGEDGDVRLARAPGRATARGQRRVRQDGRRASSGGQHTDGAHFADSDCGVSAASAFDGPEIARGTSCGGGMPHGDGNGGTAADAALAPHCPLALRDDDRGHRRPADHQGSHRRHCEDHHTGDGDGRQEGSPGQAPARGHRRLRTHDPQGSARDGLRRHGVLGDEGLKGREKPGEHDLHVPSGDVGDASGSVLDSLGRADCGVGIEPSSPPHRRAAARPRDGAHERGDAGRVGLRDKRPRRDGAHGREPRLGAGGPWPGAAGGNVVGSASSDLMPWQRPPSWLYLPSQGIHGHGHCGPTCDAAVDDTPWDPGVHEAAIKGRPPTPGREGRVASGDGQDTLGGSCGAPSGGGVGEVRDAHATTCSARGGSRRGDAATRSARTYLMEAYFESHRARVQKRREADSHAGAPSAATASERLAALRRRIQEKRSASSRPVGGIAAAKAGAADASTCAGVDTSGTGKRTSGEPETGASPGRLSSPWRNELPKMHFEAVAEDACRISDPACGASSCQTEGARRCSTGEAEADVAMAGVGDLATPSATADAARCFAWHAIEGAEVQPP